MRTGFLSRLLAAVFVLALLLPGGAQAQPPVYPEVISLPEGWMPEGIAPGKGFTFFAGSRANGAVYRGSLRTGEGEVFVPGQSGRVAVGLKYDRRCNLLFVSGAATGQAYVHDGTTAAEVRVYQLSDAPAFINDVVVTRDAAYFTNSQRAELYRVALDDCQPAADFTVLPLTGDWAQVTGFNANGIVASPNGKQLIVVNSTTGRLYNVDPQSGAAAEIDLQGESMTNGDGLVLRGRTLYVVRNQLNQIAVVQLNPDWSEGEVVGELTSPNFDVPTTAMLFGHALYAVNARFSTTPTPTTPYTVVRVELNR